jgi:hypothetical protein
MLLFKVSALQKIAEYCRGNWDVVSKTNNEARLGTVAKHLGLTIGRYSPDIRRNIKWHDTKFVGNGMIYHPWKKVDVEVLESDFDQNIYCQNGGGMGDAVALVSKILYEEQDNSSSKIYFQKSTESYNERLVKLLSIFNTTKTIVYVDSCEHPEIERKFLGYVQDHQFQYYPAKEAWKYNDDMPYDICYQFETAKESVWYNPCKVMSEELQTSILKWWEDKGFRVCKLGLPNDLEVDIATIRNSKMFVGIDSGFAHLCHVLCIPSFIKEFDKNIQKHLEWHYLDLFHANKHMASFYDMDELRRKTDCYMKLKPWQKQKWKNSSIFRRTWSDRTCYYTGANV